jgi:hypothetical protein
LFNGEASEITLSMGREIGVHKFSFLNEYKAIDELAFFSTKKKLYLEQSEMA